MEERPNIVKMKVPNTKFWVLGEQKTDKTWDVYVIDPDTNIRQLIKEDATTSAFAIFSGVILKTPFPHIREHNNEK